MPVIYSALLITTSQGPGKDPKPAMAASSGFGLEEIGIPGRDYLREALTSCTDPLKAIEDFQVDFIIH